MTFTNGAVEEDQPSYDRVRAGIHSFCLWSWILCAIGFGVFLIGFARFIPPPQESWSATRVAAEYATNRTGIRVGVLGAMFASALLIPFFAVVSKELRRIEGKDSLLAPVQFGGGLILVAGFQFVCLFWLLASFRPGADPQLIRFANDFCWLTWALLIPTYVLQFACLALGGFMDHRPRPALPRWSAYMNIVVGLSGVTGIACVFFKTGTFSWNGFIGYWVPVFGFGVGMTVDMALLVISHRRDVAALAHFHNRPVASRARTEQAAPQASSVGHGVTASV